jgi:competence protein ComEA
MKPIGGFAMQAASRARRWLAFVLPILALVALTLIGRRATNVATAAPTQAVGDAAAPVEATTGGAATAAASDSQPASAPRPAVEQLADGGVLVDLNLASEDDLRRLPGIGPARARNILELRARLGRFKSVDDLARIKGFGKAMIRRLRPLTRAGA